MDRRSKFFGNFLNVSVWIFMILGVGCLIGAVVCVILIGLGKGDPTLVIILTGSFLGGLVLSAVAGFLFVKANNSFEKKAADAFERSDGENSFLVGEEMLLTLEEGRIRIHGSKSSMTCPYSEIRVFSVCTRRAPKEKGEWSVLFEVPARYFARKEKGKKDDGRKVFVQTDGKERLYRALERFSLPLLGEQPPRGEKQKAEKFERTERFALPDPKRRKRAILTLIAGGILSAAGIAVSFWNLTAGVAFLCFGLYALLHGFVAFRKAYFSLSLYREGLFYHDPSGAESTFLRWEETVRFGPQKEEGKICLRVETAYGAFDFPMIDGAYQSIKTQFPDKCGG